MTKAEYTRLWRKKNALKFKEQEKAYYNKHKTSILKTKAKYESSRKKTDINFKLKKLLRSRLSNAIRHKSCSAVKDLGCSIEELKIHLESQFKPGMTWDNYGFGPNKWQIDHIKPLCKFNLFNIEEAKQACNYSNLQPIWWNDHILKTKNDLTIQHPMRSHSLFQHDL